MLQPGKQLKLMQERPLPKQLAELRPERLRVLLEHNRTGLKGYSKL
jgi:hypothetical protein